jgi:hypothetical protein
LQAKEDKPKNEHKRKHSESTHSKPDGARQDRESEKKKEAEKRKEKEQKAVDAPVLKVEDTADPPLPLLPVSVQHRVLRDYVEAVSL